MKIIFKVAILLLLVTKLLASDGDNDWITSGVFEKKDIIVKKGMATTLQFSNIIDYFVVGDELIVDAERINTNSLFISAKKPNMRTNLNVSTLGGNFVFVITTVDYEDTREAHLHIYVGDLANKLHKEIQKKIKQERNKFLKNANFDYKFNMYSKLFCGIWFCDYKKIAPRKVWTDGVYTYLDYNTSDGTIRDIPHIMTVTDGIDTPIRYDIKNNVVVVQKLVKKLTIVSNGTYLCIEYNGGKYEILS